MKAEEFYVEYANKNKWYSSEEGRTYQDFVYADLIKFAEAYHENETKHEQGEKDMLYKILFDLRKDVNDLKGKITLG